MFKLSSKPNQQKEHQTYFQKFCESNLSYPIQYILLLSTFCWIGLLNIPIKSDQESATHEKIALAHQIAPSPW